MVSSFVIFYDGVTSSSASISCGVKQGGILSPYLFSFFINDLLVDIEKSPFGALIGEVFTGVVSYADDIFLLSKSPSGMQSMIDMAFDFGVKWKIKFNPDPGKSDIICFNSGSLKLPRFFLGSDEIFLTTQLTHLGFLWDTVDKTLLLSHGQARVKKFIAQCYNFVNRGIQKCHPHTIATVIKVQLFPLLYGMEIGCYSDSQLAIWNRMLNSSIKGLFRCSKYCSNLLLECLDLSNLIEYLDFKRSILEHMIFSNPYTRSILSVRLITKSNSLCTSSEAMLGVKRRKALVLSGENGFIDSLRSLIFDWNNFQSQKQFRDLLHFMVRSSPMGG